MQTTYESIPLGGSGNLVSPLGMGTWQWGDTSIWGFGKLYGQADVESAYQVSREAGITFFDTAEIYGSGASEKILGSLVRRDPAPVVVASKFAGVPFHWTARAMARALDASLARLGLDQVDLYQVHWPYLLSGVPALMHAMADLVEAGKVRAVGVSNFSATQMRSAHATLARRGLPLASNQVHYSLLHRHPERNGVLKACRELDVRLIAYSPLEQGLLTGKYHDGTTQVTGLRRWRGMRPAAIQASAPVVQLLRQIGEAHDGKTPSQVALSWLMRQGALPIPGAKNAAQARSNAGALGWELTDEEYARLNALRSDGHA